MIKIYTISFIKNTFCSPIRSMDYSKDFNDHKGALFVLLRPYMARFTNSRILCHGNGYFLINVFFTVQLYIQWQYS